MSDLLFSPPFAFLIYVILVGILSGLGRILAGPANQTAAKTSTYHSGEAPPGELAAPGYRPFFVVALFFAVLHLGVLVVGSNDIYPLNVIYLAGLLLALVALILG